MKKIAGIAAVIGLGISLTWAAGQVGGWLGFSQQEPAEAQDESSAEEAASTSVNGDVPPPSGAPENESVPSSADASPPAVPELAVEAESIEEDLARIEEALQSEEVLEEFTPSEPLSADNPIPMPTDI